MSDQPKLDDETTRQQEIQEAEELRRLEERLERILRDDARRHGIDV